VRNLVTLALLKPSESNVFVVLCQFSQGTGVPEKFELDPKYVHHVAWENLAIKSS
jgi:hypothetical protein